VGNVFEVFDMLVGIPYRDESTSVAGDGVFKGLNFVLFDLVARKYGEDNVAKQRGTTAIIHVVELRVKWWVWE
jgi:hypothetical protein